MAQTLATRGHRRASLPSLRQESACESHRYAALYEVRKTDAEAAFAELNARAGTEHMPLSPTLDNDVHAVPFAPEGVIDATA